MLTKGLWKEGGGWGATAEASDWTAYIMQIYASSQALSM